MTPLVYMRASLVGLTVKSLPVLQEWRTWQPLQCSCLENPRDRGAWWAFVYGVAQSRTRLKRLSSSSRNHFKNIRDTKGTAHANSVQFSPSVVSNSL